MYDCPVVCHMTILEQVQRLIPATLVKEAETCDIGHPSVERYAWHKSKANYLDLNE